MSIAGKNFAVIGAGIVGSALSLWQMGRVEGVALRTPQRQAFLKRPTIKKETSTLP